MPFPRLPDSAAAKLAEINDEARDLEARVLATQDRIRLIGKDTATKTPEEAGAIRNELDRLRRKMELDQFAARTASDLATTLRFWLERVPVGMDLAVADLAPSTRKAGETHRQAVDRLRDHVHGLSLRRREVAASLPPAEALYPLADAFVEQKAREFPLRVRFVDGMVSFTTEGEPKAMATAAWLHGDAMKRRLRLELDRAREASKAEVMSRDQRDLALADIDQQITLAEREEEAIIVEGRESESAVIERRANASPMAILGVTLVPRPAPPSREPPATVEEALATTRAEIRDVPPRADATDDALRVAVGDPLPGSAGEQRARAKRR